jgi:hypothetical protein
MKSKMLVRFPFRATQVGDDLLEIDMDARGVAFPELSVHAEVAARFDAAFGIAPRDHEALLERLQSEYMQRLVIASIKVENISA